MNKPVLAIKTHVPHPREDLVQRPHLVERIIQGLQSRLILVSAPAGFGKTTLVASWIQASDRPIAWLSLDENENEIRRFLSCLVAAFQRLDEDLGVGIQSVLESQTLFQSQLLLTNLIDEVAKLGAPVSLILDDCHLIENEEIHRELEFLIHNMPPDSNVIMIGRVDPQIPLSRLRAGGELTEIRSRDLRFTEEEVDAFLNDIMNLGLTTDQTISLRLRTEGWIVGLQLAALSLRGLTDKQAFIERFSGSHQYIIDYLMEEVLDGLPKEVQDFLYRISILDRFCAPLCDAVLEIQNSDQIIKRLEQDDLFLVPLDEDQRWYRFHHLFVDFLRHASHIDVETLVKMHGNASEWFERQGEHIEAFEHRVEANDIGKALRIIENIGMRLLEESKLAALIGLIRSLPQQEACSRPWISIYHAWALRLTGGGYDAVERQLHCAEESAGMVDLTDLGQSETPIAKHHVEDLDRIRGHITALRAYQALYREDIPSVIHLAKEALDYRPEGNFIRTSIALAQGWAYRFMGDLKASSESLLEARAVGLASNNTYLAVASTCRLAYGYYLSGRLQEAAELCQEALQIATLKSGKQLPVAGYAHIYLGLIHLTWNELDVAKRCFLEGIKLSQQVGYVMDQIIGYSQLAKVYLAEDEMDAAHQALSQAEQLSQKMKGYLYAQRWVDDCKVRFWGARGELERLSSWVQECGLSTNDTPNFIREVDQLILARALFYLYHENPDDPIFEDLLAFMEKIQETVHAAGWVSKEIEILVLQSLVHQQKKEEEQAMRLFESALRLAEPESHLRPFLDEGEPIQILSLNASSLGFAVDFCQKLLDAFDDTQEISYQAKEQVEAQGLVDPLSRRELEVLDLLASDLSGPEIADRLVIAVSTLRYHTNQIYTKLAVHSRREAVSRARELEII